MKKFAIILLSILVLTALFGCRTIQYVPVESTKIEYRDSYLHDSIHVVDSVVIREGRDTVQVEKYRFMFWNKLVFDSVFIRDTVRVPYPVEVEKPVNYISGWQNFQIWSGRILLGLLALFLIFKFSNPQIFKK
ncbi:MAG: hypothetical protein LBE91_14765 [Tannerella sp.]|jgi:hypothetical protein|nr:hypothetical protein [Tannerella sp.]